MLDKKNIINSGLVAAAAMNFTSAMADAPSTDQRYEDLRRIMRDYVQNVVRDECAYKEDFNYDAFTWDDYEIEGLEIVLLDTIKHTASYCKPPELTGMHSKVRAHPGSGTSQK